MIRADHLSQGQINGPDVSPEERQIDTTHGRFRAA